MEYCGTHTHVVQVGQDIVGHDLRQRGVTGVGDRETVGAVGTRVDLGDLASGDEVGVLVALDFLRNVHRRGGRDVEVRRRVTHVVGAATDAVVRVAQALVLGRRLSTVAGHERHGIVRVLAGSGRREHVHVEGGVEATFDRVGYVPADQSAARSV